MIDQAVESDDGQQEGKSGEDPKSHPSSRSSVRLLLTMSLMVSGVLNGTVGSISCTASGAQARAR